MDSIDVPRRFRLRRHKRTAFCILLMYITTYLVMSRVGYRRADEYGLLHFWFVPPLSPATTIANDVCFVVFYPLVQFELLLGTGRGRASDPILKLSSLLVSAAEGKGSSGPVGSATSQIICP